MLHCTQEIIKGTVEFKEVEFHYPNRRSVAVLRRMSMMIESGATVALVGSSGCGKSTTVQLLERFYDHCTGTIVRITIVIKRLTRPILLITIAIIIGTPISTLISIVFRSSKTKSQKYVIPEGMRSIVSQT